MPTKALRALLPAIAVAAIALPTAPMPHLRKRSGILGSVHRRTVLGGEVRTPCSTPLAVSPVSGGLHFVLQRCILPFQVSTDERHEQRKQAIPHPLCKYSELLHLTDVVVRRPFLVAGAG